MDVTIISTNLPHFTGMDAFTRHYGWRTITVIPAGTLWQTVLTIANQAATLWYHPYLINETTQEQLTKVLEVL
jgi:hypothetical protein